MSTLPDTIRECLHLNKADAAATESINVGQSERVVSAAAGVLR
ncbi:MAG: hypothetical protein QM754_10365 [Tepidisphaeraceae bacterium]